MSLFRHLARLVQDPPPEMAFELSEAGIAWARDGRRGVEAGFAPLPPGVISVSPVRDNVLQAELLSDAVAALVPANGARKRRQAALILPDYCARVAVIDFDAFPSKPEEQLALVRFRLKRGVAFDLDASAVAYFAQPREGAGTKEGKPAEVVACVAGLEILSRYEAPLRAAGLHPGFVTTSTLAMLNLTDRTGDRLIAKLAGRALTVSAIHGGRLRMVRCVELDSTEPADIEAVLYPTFAYMEDELKSRPAAVQLCGFGALAAALAEQIRQEFQVEAGALAVHPHLPAEWGAGLSGYLRAQGAG